MLDAETNELKKMKFEVEAWLEFDVSCCLRLAAGDFLAPVAYRAVSREKRTSPFQSELLRSSVEK